MGELMEEDIDICESELHLWEYKSYIWLKEGDETVNKNASENEFKCPYCLGKENQILGFKELLQHASVGSPREWGARERGMHLGLKKYLETVIIKRESSSSMDADREPSNELLVCPWMGIIANIPIQKKNGRYFGASGTKIRDELTIQGFNPFKVHALWNYKGHSGLAIVEFRKEWLGFNDAIKFEKSFEANRHGKKHYFGERRDDQLYGWVARADDYNANNVVGEHLKKNGDLKTIKQYQEEEHRKNQKLVINLTSQLENKDLKVKEMEKKCNESSLSLSKVIQQKDAMLRSFNEEREKLQRIARGQLQKIFHDHGRMTSELEEKRIELKKIEKELETREAHNEKRRLMLQQEQNEKAILEQKRVDAKMLELAEDHKKEQEKLNKKTIELEKQFDAKQALELKIQRLKGTLRVKQHMGDGEDVKEDPGSLNVIEEELKEKEEELEDLEALNQALVIKERKVSEELQEARKELIKGLSGPSSSASSVGVKKMGELNSKAFAVAAARKYSRKEAEAEAVKLWSEWDDFIKDPSWHPFKTLQTGNNGKVVDKVIINEDDEKLKYVKKEYGIEAYKSVISALMEIEEYNPSGRFPIPELWNYTSKKRASLNDGITHLVKQWVALKKKKR